MVIYFYTSSSDYKPTFIERAREMREREMMDRNVRGGGRERERVGEYSREKRRKRGRGRESERA